MIDALFGSKTRIKLLHLFLNNPGKAFYVREITRKIDEQINSVRRELANMLKVGIIKSDSADNKLYYEVNQRYEHYVPLRAIFADDASAKGAVQPQPAKNIADEWSQRLMELGGGVRLALLAGVFVPGSLSPVDIMLAGNLPEAKVTKWIKEVEKTEGREINYSVLSYDEFYYRLSVRDKFLTDILGGKHLVLKDTEQLLDRRK